MTPGAWTGHLLVLNTAEGPLHIAVGRKADASGPVELLCAQEWRIVSQGAEMLTPLIASTLERLHLDISDISRIACVSGPGSFTGIRLAVSTAAGLARARRGELLQGSVALLPLLAKSAAARAPWLFTAGKGHMSPVWIITHARKNLVHAQGFTVRPCESSDSPYPQSPSGLPAFSSEPLTDILVCSVEETARAIQAGTAKAGSLQGPPPVLAGSGVNRNRNALKALLPEALLLPEAYAVPDASVLVDEAAACAFADADIVPAYIRPCDAEESLPSIAASLGLDPHKAREALDRLTGLPG